MREADGDENDNTDDGGNGAADGGNGGNAAAGLGLRRWLVEEGRIVELNNQAKHAVSNWSDEVTRMRWFATRRAVAHLYDGALN